MPQGEAHAFVDLYCRPRCLRGPSDHVQHRQDVHQLGRPGAEGILFWEPHFGPVLHQERARGALRRIRYSIREFL